MKFAISAEVRSRAVLLRIQKLARGLAPDQRAMTNRKLSDSLLDWVHRNFDSEGRLAQPQGWLPLKPSTLMARARRIEGKGKRSTVRKLYRRGLTMSAVAQITKDTYGTAIGQFQILQDTRYMHQSFQPFYDASMAGVGTLRSRTHANLSAFHQYGVPGRNLPARPMLPTREQAQEIGIRVYKLQVQKLTAAGAL